MLPSSASLLNDFLLPSDWAPSDWDLVSVGGGSIQQAEEESGLLRVSTGAAPGNFQGLFLKDHLWKTSAPTVSWAARVRLQADQAEATILAGLSNGNPNDRVSFSSTNGTVQCSCVAAGSATHITLPGLDLTQWTTLSLECDGSEARFYVDGAHVGTITTTIPSSSLNLRTSFQLINGGSSAKTLDIDGYLVSKPRS